MPIKYIKIDDNDTDDIDHNDDDIDDCNNNDDKHFINTELDITRPMFKLGYPDFTW